jgi:hypothetical protein
VYYDKPKKLIDDPSAAKTQKNTKKGQFSSNARAHRTINQTNKGIATSCCVHCK